MLSLHVPVTHTKKSCWMVPPQTDGSIEYTIRLINKTCYCKLSCTHCHACVHMYTCTCMDATLHATVCKHVYLVQMINTNTACKDSSKHVNSTTLNASQTLWKHQFHGQWTLWIMPTSTTPDKWIKYTGSEMPTCRCTESLYTTLIICHNSDQGHRK